MGCRSRVMSRAVRQYLWQRSRALSLVPLSRGFPAAPLRFETAEAFAGVAGWYAARIRAKLKGRALYLTDLPQETARMLLLGRADVTEMLDASSMKTAGLFEPAALERFLLDAANPGFSKD